MGMDLHMSEMKMSSVMLVVIAGGRVDESWPPTASQREPSFHHPRVSESSNSVTIPLRARSSWPVKNLTGLRMVTLRSRKRPHWQEQSTNSALGRDSPKYLELGS